MSEAKKYIFNKSEDSLKVNILIDGEIDAWWGVGLRELAKDISNSGANEIMMQINSGGGSVFEGMAISSFIKGKNIAGINNINTSILGLCASIATPIALSGKTTSIAKGSLFMIHNASGGVWGEAKDMEDTAKLLKTIDEQLVQIYTDTIGKNGKLINDSREETEIQVREWQNNETWFTAEESVDHGFIQKLTEGVEFVNKAQAQEIVNTCSKYNNVPTTFLNKVKTIANMAEPKEEAPKLSMIDTLKAWFKSNPKEASDLINSANEDKQAKELAEKNAAIAYAKANGFYKEPNSEEEESDDLEEMAVLKAELEAFKLIAQKLEEEKDGAPSSSAPSVKDSDLTDKEKIFNKHVADKQEELNAMAKAIFN